MIHGSVGDVDNTSTKNWALDPVLARVRVTVFAGDEKLTTALLDRLAHHATVITTKRKELPDAQTP